MVGGHCIGVDPYYLTYKAKSVGHIPQIILAGRKINDNMGSHIVSEVLKKMEKKKINIKNSKILIMGLTFKENCSDIRNSGVKMVFERLKKYTHNIDLYDPWTDSEEIKKIYGINSQQTLDKDNYDGVIIAVAHKMFIEMGKIEILNLCKKNHVIYDLKYLFTKEQIDLRL